MAKKIIRQVIRFILFALAFGCLYYGIEYTRCNVYSLKPEEQNAPLAQYNFLRMTDAVTFDGLLRVDSRFYDTASLSPTGKGVSDCPT